MQLYMTPDSLGVIARHVSSQSENCKSGSLLFSGGTAEVPWSMSPNATKSCLMAISKILAEESQM